MINTKMKKIILVGASTPNLFGAKRLKEKGFEVLIFERNPNHQNNQMRRLPTILLDKLGIETNLEKEFDYIRLSQIKDFLSKEIDILYNTNLIIDFENLEFKHNEEMLEFDFIIINTGHKEIIIDNPKIHTYNYTLDNPQDHFSGNSLMSSINKIDLIVENIISNSE